MDSQSAGTDNSSETIYLPFKAEPGIEIEVEYNIDAFRPNRVSEHFAKAIPVDLEGLIVDDIGSGGGVLAIIEARRGAREVRAVEPALTNYKLLLKNIQRNVNPGIIRPYNGVFFDPIWDLLPADIISADVSGIPETVARALGWYPEGVPTGGQKGSEVTCELLKRSPRYLKETGKIYFPTANDLLNANEIIEVARENYRCVKNALCSDEEKNRWNREASESNGKLWKSPEYVWFPLRDEDIKKLEVAYKGKIPSTVSIQEVKGKYFWRGQIYEATLPKKP
jgi:hypothetical protein